MLLRNYLLLLNLLLPLRVFVIQILLMMIGYRLADKSKKLNVNAVMGIQNMIAIVISSISKKYQTNNIDSLEIQLSWVLRRPAHKKRFPSGHSQLWVNVLQ